MYACKHACGYVVMREYIFVCMCVCMHACTHEYVCGCVRIQYIVIYAFLVGSFDGGCLFIVPCI